MNNLTKKWLKVSVGSSTKGIKVDDLIFSWISHINFDVGQQI